MLARRLRGAFAIRVALVAATVALLGAGAAAADPLAVTVTQTDPLLGQRMRQLPPLEMTGTVPAATTPLVTVNDAQTYQKVSGFGAAMTDSSAWLIANLPAAARQTLESNLFSPSRLGLDLLRIPVGASDFTVNGVPYTYDDLPPNQTDPHLLHFSIQHDEAYTIPALQQALALNPQLQFLASPWTAPAWMKANDSLSNVHNKGTLLGQYWGTWAAYLVKFLQGYAAAGIPISGLTVQNEPGNATTYPGMNLAAWAEAKFTAENLVPDLKRANLHPQLFGNDLGWASQTFAKAVATTTPSGALTGLSWHCYYGSPSVMSAIRQLRPTLQTIVSECSPGISAIPIPEVMISSLRNWAGDVALWNLALEPNGGPVERPNTGCSGCYGLVAINPATEAVSYNLPYFDVGQASTFIEPGATRIASNTFVSYDYTKPGVDFVSAGVDDVAFENPDGSRAMIAYNNSSQPISFAVGWHGDYFTYTLPAQAMVSFAWNRGPSSPAGAAAGGTS